MFEDIRTSQNCDNFFDNKEFIGITGNRPYFFLFFIIQANLTSKPNFIKLLASCRLQSSIPPNLFIDEFLKFI